MAGLGDEFRAAREARHLSLADVSDQIHIRPVYLQSIEAEDWAALSAPVYARGFIRTYARFLGLDGERAVAEFGKGLDDAPPRRTEVRFGRPGRARRSPWLWLATVVAACLVGFVAFKAARLWQEDRTAASPPVARAAGEATPASRQSAASATEAPVARGSVANVSQTVASRSGAIRPGTSRTAGSQAAAAGVAAASGAHALEVQLTQRAWLTVSVDGTRELIGIFPAGTRRVFHGAQASVRTGNGAGVALTVNGKKLGAMGPPGAVVERRLSLREE